MKQEFESTEEVSRLRLKREMNVAEGFQKLIRFVLNVKLKYEVFCCFLVCLCVCVEFGRLGCLVYERGLLYEFGVFWKFEYG